MKRQIIFIHGGETFDTYEEYVDYLKNCEIDFSQMFDVRKRWIDAVAETLKEEYEAIKPAMPSKYNAKYSEWKIWFEKYLPIIREDAVYIGHSLGGIFLAKYLAENDLPKKAAAVFLIAAPYDDADTSYSLADFTLPPSLQHIGEQVSRIVLMHSEDDHVVPFADFLKYQTALPDAKVVVFKDRGHFLQESFPELVHEITLLR